MIYIYKYTYIYIDVHTHTYTYLYTEMSDFIGLYKSAGFTQDDRFEKEEQIAKVEILASVREFQIRDHQ